MKPANNAETAAATHAKEDARCREEGARKRESGGVYVVYAALRGLRYSLKGLPRSSSFRIPTWIASWMIVSREKCNFSIHFLDEGGGRGIEFKFKNGRTSLDRSLVISLILLSIP